MTLAPPPPPPPTPKQTAVVIAHSGGTTTGAMCAPSKLGKAYEVCVVFGNINGHTVCKEDLFGWRWLGGKWRFGWDTNGVRVVRCPKDKSAFTA